MPKYSWNYHIKNTPLWPQKSVVTLFYVIIIIIVVCLFVSWWKLLVNVYFVEKFFYEVIIEKFNFML